MAEHFLTTLDDSRLIPFQNLKQSNQTRNSNIFIAEGIRVVQRLLKSKFKVQSIVISERQRHRFPEDIGAEIDVFVLPPELTNELVGFQFHAGVIACGERPQQENLSDWHSRLKGHRRIIVCPHLTDPENVGTMIRLSAGFGIDGLILGSRSTDPLSRRSIRVSMGHAFYLPIHQSMNVLSDLELLRETYDYELVAVELTESAISLKDLTAKPRMALLFGNESEGLSPEFLSVADKTTMIPMHGQVDSLNVSISAAIVMHHLSE